MKMYLLFLFSAFFLSLSQCMIDCSPGSPTGIQPDCWDALEMSQYISNWMEQNGSSANCASLGFAQCYLQWHGYNGVTCNLITSDTCPPFDTTNGTYDSDEEFYALWNIYAIYQFFNQYSTALSNGVALAGQTIDAIVAAVAPPVASQTESNSIFDVMAGSLTFFGHSAGLGIPGGPGRLPNVIAAGIALALGMGTGISGSLTNVLLDPMQTANERFVELGQVGSSLAQIVTKYQENILSLVQTIQGNATLFVAICSTGGFSQPITTTLTGESDELFHELEAYILSQALQANGYVITRSTGISALEVAAQTSNVNCPSLSSVSTCNQWWIDGDTYTTYSLHNPNDPENDQVALTNQIINNGWANLTELFKVELCSGKPVSFNQNTIGTNCVFNMTWCAYNYTANFAYLFSSQFLNCPNDPNWGTLCSSFTESILLPQSYLGPLLFNDDNFCREL